MASIAWPLCSAPAFVAAQEAAPASPTFKPEELEQIVAPIALYPDPLLAQVLMASTYPLEVVEAARWSRDNPTVTGDAVADAVQSQSWDPSVKSLVAFPEVLAMMNDKLDWIQKVGDAFLAQQADVMNAVQRLRAKAQAEGTLQSGEQQTVTTENVPAPPPTAESVVAPANAAPAAPAPEPAAAAPVATTTVIKIEPTNPEVVYVPTYNPTVVYGPWPYPAYPPYYYYPPGYTAGAAFFSFSVGVAVGSALWGNCNWGGNDVNINVNRYNDFNRTNVGNSVGGDGSWKHDPSHRKGVQYRDSATQGKYGKTRDASATQSREAFRGHAEQGRQELARDGATRDLAGNPIGERDTAGGARSQTGNGQNRSGQASTARNPTATDRSTADRSTATNRPSSSSSRGSSSASRSNTPDAYRGIDSGSASRTNSQRGSSSRSAGGFSGGGGMSRGGGRR